MFATSLNHGTVQPNGLGHLATTTSERPSSAAAPLAKQQQQQQHQHQQQQPNVNVPGTDPHALASALAKVRAGKVDTLDPAEVAAFQQAKNYMAGLRQAQHPSQPHPAAAPPPTTTTTTTNGLVNGHAATPPPPVPSTSAAAAPPDLAPRSRWFTKESTSLDDRIGPPLSSLEQRRLKEWLGRDAAHERAFAQEKNTDMPRRVGEAVRDEVERSGDWLGGWRTREQVQQAKARRGGLSFRMVEQRERDLMRGKRGDRAVGLGLHRLIPSATLVQHQQQPRHHHQPPPQPQKVLIRRRLGKRKMKEIAEEEEMLVPIRLEIEHEHWKLRDTFTWNLRETVISPDDFARLICRDLILPPDLFVKLISAQVREQLDEFRLHEHFEGHVATAWSSDEVRAREDLGEGWWEAWRSGKGFGRDPGEGPVKKPRLEGGDEMVIDRAGKEDGGELTLDSLLAERAQPVDAFPRSLEMRDDELRIPITLDILLGKVQLTDRFDWEVSEPDRNSPELFAEAYAADLGLSGEFKTAIAHAIREQVEIYVKSLSLVEHQAGFLVPNDELRFAFLHPVADAFRGSGADVDGHTPVLASLSAEELDRTEKEHDREARRKRRQTRGRRGVALPDRDPPRTARTVVPVQGVAMVQPFQDENDETVFPQQPVPLAYPIVESLPPATATAAAGGVSSSTAGGGSTGGQRGTPAPSAAAGAGDKKPGEANGRDPGTPGASIAGGASGKVGVGRATRRLRGAMFDLASAEGTPGPDDDMFDDTSSVAATETKRAGAKRGRQPGDDEFVDLGSGDVEDEEGERAGAGVGAGAGAGAVAGGPKKRKGFDWAAHGLHDVMVDGVWHCSNCGCPDHIAVGRRKGPGGDRTLCGECGRYAHRYKKNRPTPYTTDPAYHQNLRDEADAAKKEVADQEAARKQQTKAAASAKREREKAEKLKARRDDAADSAKLPPSGGVKAEGGEEEEGLTGQSPLSSISREGSPRPSSRSRKRVSSETPSETSLSTLAPAGRGGSTTKAGQRRGRSSSVSSILSDVAPAPSRSQKSGPPAPAPASVAGAGPSPSMSRSGTGAGQKPPNWMLEQLAALRHDYKDDKVELLLKPKKEPPAAAPVADAAAEWRMRCIDCPGKLYTTGPGETFTNFLVHLKNRSHRQKVEHRLKGLPPPS